LSRVKIWASCESPVLLRRVEIDREVHRGLVPDLSAQRSRPS
jgi:hypothetical protein